MTAEEFKRVLQKLYVAFPSIKDWVERSSPDVAGTHRAWFRAVEKFCFAECEAVIDSWIDGSKPAPSYQEQTQIGLALRACVMFDQSKKRKQLLSENQIALQSESEARSKRKQRANYVPLFGAFSKCLDYIGQAECGRITQLESEAMVAKEVLKLRTDAEYDGPRYRCATCFDRGLVYVFHPWDVDRRKTGEDIECGQCVVRCTCSEADKFQNAKLQEYSSFRYCRTDENLDDWLAPKMMIDHGNYQSNAVL